MQMYLQSLFCHGFVPAMFAVSGKAARTCAWMPLSSALKTWRGSEDVEATSSGGMVCVLAPQHLEKSFNS